MVRRQRYPGGRKVKGDPSKEKTRKCLRCNKEFLSTWSGNRICQNCTKSVDEARRSIMYTIPVNER